MSSQNSVESTKVSFGIIERFSEIFNISADNKTLKYAEKILRKSAHFGLYTVLGGCIMLTVSVVKKPGFKYILLSVVLSCIYAVTDEYHQTFVNGRSGELRDVLIDTGGALLGTLIIYLILKLKKREKSL